MKNKESTDPGFWVRLESFELLGSGSQFRVKNPASPFQFLRFWVPCPIYDSQPRVPLVYFGVLHILGPAPHFRDPCPTLEVPDPGCLFYILGSCDWDLASHQVVPSPG